MHIVLKRPANCAQCGAALPVGTPAKWYRNGKVYGTACHERAPNLKRSDYQGEDYECSDMGYEDQCQRATGA